MISLPTRDQLLRDGFCTVNGVLDRAMLERVTEVCDRLLNAQPAEHFDAQRSTGSMISVFSDPFFAELVAWPGALEAVADLGFPDPRWSSGFVISKPPHSPPLFWHQDWTGWNDDSSYQAQPQQLFLMYYLIDTEPGNGCLRLIPGSHRKRHRLHDDVPDAHTDEIKRMMDPDHPAYQPVADSVDVPVRAGDLVIGDSRLLHGSYGNRSDRRRTVITLWYFPAFEGLSGPLRAHLTEGRIPESWPESACTLVAPLWPRYTGAAEPLEVNRKPGPGLT